MRSDILEKVALDLISLPPLFFRVTRRKLIKIVLSDIPVEITPLHFEIMRLLKEEGVLHAAEIGKKLQIARAQMTQLIDKLVDLDMVEREVGTADRRTMNIKLTGNGKMVLEERRNYMMSAVRETVSDLTDKDLTDLMDSLGKLRTILSKLL